MSQSRDLWWHWQVLGRGKLGQKSHPEIAAPYHPLCRKGHKSSVMTKFLSNCCWSMASASWGAAHLHFLLYLKGNAASYFSGNSSALTICHYLRGTVGAVLSVTPSLSLSTPLLCAFRWFKQKTNKKNWQLILIITPWHAGPSCRCSIQTFTLISLPLGTLECGKVEFSVKERFFNLGSPRFWLYVGGKYSASNY